MRPKSKRSTPKTPKATPGSHLFVAAGVDQDMIVERLGHLPKEGYSLSNFSTEAVLEALEKGAAPLIIVPDTLRAIAGAIARGVQPSTALDDWHETSSTILELQRQNRRRILLVAEGYFLRASEEDASPALAERVSLKGAALVEKCQIDTVSLCLAIIALQSSAKITKVAAQLEASSLHHEEAPLSLGEIDTAFALVQDAAAQLQDLQTHLDLAQKKVASRETALAQEQGLYRAQLAQLQAEIAESAQREKDLQERIAVATGQSTTNQAALSKAEAALEDEKRALATARSKVGKQADDIAAAASRETALVQEQGLYRAQLAQLQTEIAESTQREKDLQERIAAATGQSTINQAALSKAEAALEDEKKALAAARSKVGKLGADLEQSREIVGKQTDDIAAAASRETALVQEQGLYRAQLAQLQTEIAESTQREKDLQEGIAAATGQNTTTQKALSKARNELVIARKSLALAEERRSRIRLDTSAAEDRAMTQFNQIKRLGRELAQARAGLAEAEAQARQSQQREQELSARAAFLEAEHTKVLMSQSWRVTKPLRMANTVLRNPTRKK